MFTLQVQYFIQVITCIWWQSRRSREGSRYPGLWWLLITCLAFTDFCLSWVFSRCWVERYNFDHFATSWRLLYFEYPELDPDVEGGPCWGLGRWECLKNWHFLDCQWQFVIHSIALAGKAGSKIPQIILYFLQNNWLSSLHWSKKWVKKKSLHCVLSWLCQFPLIIFRHCFFGIKHHSIFRIPPF